MFSYLFLVAVATASPTTAGRPTVAAALAADIGYCGELQKEYQHHPASLRCLLDSLAQKVDKHTQSRSFLSMILAVEYSTTHQQQSKQQQRGGREKDASNNMAIN